MIMPICKEINLGSVRCYNSNLGFQIGIGLGSALVVCCTKDQIKLRKKC